MFTVFGIALRTADTLQYVPLICTHCTYVCSMRGMHEQRIAILLPDTVVRSKKCNTYYHYHIQLPSAQELCWTWKLRKSMSQNVTYDVEASLTFAVLWIALRCWQSAESWCALRICHHDANAHQALKGRINKERVNATSCTRGRVASCGSPLHSFSAGSRR